MDGMFIQAWYKVKSLIVLSYTEQQISCVPMMQQKITAVCLELAK